MSKPKQMEPPVHALRDTAPGPYGGEPPKVPPLADHAEGYGQVNEFADGEPPAVPTDDGVQRTEADALPEPPPAVPTAGAAVGDDLAQLDGVVPPPLEDQPSADAGLTQTRRTSRPAGHRGGAT